MHPSMVVLVLHRPSSAENIGAVARAMKNFGLTRLAVVEPPSWNGLPRGGGPGHAREEVLTRARKTARHAVDLLQAMELHVDLQGALATATWSCGTTSRSIPGRPRLTPHELAGEVARRSVEGGEVRIVFGEERRGLSDRELELCQAVCSIPTAKSYESMNLAQAAAVLAYELALARQERPQPDPVPERPRHATLEALWSRLAAILSAVGYLNPQNPEHILADLRRLLGRAEPSQREVELLVAAARAIERRLETGAGPSRR
ncbi:MAG TPA: TrmH family RNA methyltransferase [Anaeromyxobacteraceae bacterium]|nr:TrmH family RNA methyltransferase [Anaeromyxobacteraceae bacterium]